MNQALIALSIAIPLTGLITYFISIKVIERKEYFFSKMIEDEIYYFCKFYINEKGQDDYIITLERKRKWGIYHSGKERNYPYSHPGITELKTGVTYIAKREGPSFKLVEWSKPKKKE